MTNAFIPGVMVPAVAEIVERTRESATVFSLRLQLVDPALRAGYRFMPGQFNMLALPGVGDVPISIVSDPGEGETLQHTIRAVGRVTKALSQLAVGAQLGLRGPFGTGWPLVEAERRDVLILTGGLGCAPTVAAIHYILRRRARYGRLTVIQGVKHADDLLWREQYAAWQQAPDTHVYIAADAAGRDWPWHVGRITDLFDRIQLDARRTLAMMCGPEGMMRAAIRRLRDSAVPDDAIYLSMERSMHCAIGQCGHCQIGPKFVCRDGPVFCYNDIRPFLDHSGL